jgi:hypothetical protein
VLEFILHVALKHTADLISGVCDVHGTRWADVGVRLAGWLRYFLHVILDAEKVHHFV